MQTTTSFKPGNAPDLLSGILSVQVRNEDKITEQDRLFCQNQQDMLYKTLDRIDRWYTIFKEEAEQYRTERDFSYDDNGKISMRDLYSLRNGLRRTRLSFPKSSASMIITCNTTNGAKSVTITVESWKPYARVSLTVRMMYCAATRK